MSASVQLRRLVRSARQAAAGRTRRSPSWRGVLLAIGMLAGLPAPAAADAVLLLGEAYGRFATFSPTGHVSLYLTRVCASTPTIVRRCAAGESGVVISRYHRVGGRDWVAVPLMPFLFAVPHAADVPATADRDTVSRLRDAYRRAWLRDIAPDLDAGGVPPGDWVQVVGSAYDRRLIGFTIATTAAQDDALIAALNGRDNARQFNLMFRNCADFVQGLLNFYYPGAIRSSLTADLGFTTPKQLAKAVVALGRRRPEAGVSGFVVAQIPGSRRQSRPARGVLEALVKTKKYVIPLTFLEPTVPAGFAAAYLIGGRFRPLQYAVRSYSPVDLEQMATSRAWVPAGSSASPPPAPMPGPAWDNRRFRSAPVSEQDEDFAALFEASTKTARQFEKGQTVAGTIVAIGPKVALVHVGGKSEAQIEVAELKDADGDIEFSVGDRLDARIVSTAGGLVLSRRGVRSAATQRELEDAYASGLAVEGRVERVVKGGYEVRIARERAFCPISQIDIARTTDPEVHVGQTYAFRIIEFKEGGKDLVVSRRAALEEEQRAQADAVRASIVPGAVLPGRVTSVLDFGAFVDLGGGIQGLLHVSEMSWSRLPSAASMVAVGDRLTVKVLRVDEATGKISLGLKQLQDDPWTAVATQYEVGQVHQGRISRIADFGAFVELAPGVEALAHASTFPPTGRSGGWAKSIAVGQVAAFEILTIDLTQKRIGVAMVEEGSARAASAAQSAIVAGALLTGKVERHEKFGIFVFLAPGRTALLPFAETGVDRDADMLKAFPPGSDVQVVVLEADPDGRRIRVSKKAVAEQQEQAELREYTSRQDATASGPSLGSLADKLRGALSTRKS